MASNSERQAAYRRRHAENGGGRINMHVEARTEFALRRLARHYAVTQREMLDRLIAEAESAVIAGMDGAAYKTYLGD